MARPTVEIRGSVELERVSRRLKEVGDTELRKQMLAGLRREGKPLIDAVKASVGDYLPTGGGAADAVRSSSFGVRTRTSGPRASVRIVGVGRRVNDLRRINAGTLRHPVFGNREAWVSQRIRPGFFDRPMESRKPLVQSRMQRVLEDIARRVERSA